jgi:hypothetical protein
MSTKPAQEDDEEAPQNQSAAAETPESEGESSGDISHPSIDPESSLIDVIERRLNMLAQVEQDGERIKEAVGEVLTKGNPDGEVTEGVRRAVGETVAQILEDHDEVGPEEIIIAHWLELKRITQPPTENDEESASDEEAAGPPQEGTDGNEPDADDEHDGAAESDESDDWVSERFPTPEDDESAEGSPETDQAGGRMFQ